jgi:hypothetical protein
MLILFEGIEMTLLITRRYQCPRCIESKDGMIDECCVNEYLEESGLFQIQLISHV